MRLKEISNKAWVVPVTIFLLSFALRLSLMSKGPYSVDCLFLTDRALETLRTGQLQPDVLPGYPLAVILATAFVFGGKILNVTDPVLSVNFMSVVLSSVTLFFFYHFVRNLLNGAAAFFGTMLFSFCPIYLGLSVYGKSHIPAVFFLILSLHWLVLYQKSYAPKYWLLSGLAFGCLGATREHDFTFMLIPVSYLYCWGEFQIRQGSGLSILKQGLKRWFLWLGLAVFIAVIFHLPFLLQSHRDAYLGTYSAEWQVSIVDNFMGFFSSRLGLAYYFLLDILHPIGFISAVVGAVLLNLKRNYKVLGFLLLWFFIPFSFLGNMRFLVTPRFFVILIPAFMIALGYFLERMFAWKRGKTIAVSLFIFLVFLGFNRVYPILKYRHDYASLPDFARWVGTVTEKNARIITSDESWFMRYYARRTPLGRPMGMDKTPPETLLAYKNQIDALLAENTPVYISQSALHAYDWHQHFSSFLKANFDFLYVGTRVYEDWHRGEMILQVTPCDLYRLVPRKRLP